MSIIGRLLPFCRGKRKMVAQVKVSAIPVESKNREEMVGFSLMYTLTLVERRGKLLLQECSRQ